jgi:hypothetical protein
MLFVAGSGRTSRPEVCASTIWWVLEAVFLCFLRHLLEFFLFRLGKGWWAV